MAFDQTKSPGAVTENRSWAVTAVSPPRTAETKMPQEDFFPFCGRWVTSILKAAPNRPILHFFLKHHHVGEPSEGWATLQDSLLGGLGYLGILPHNAQGDIVTKLKRPCCFSVMPAGIKAGSAPCGASCGICSPPYPHNSGSRTSRPQALNQEPSSPWTIWPAPFTPSAHRGPASLERGRLQWVPDPGRGPAKGTRGLSSYWIFPRLLSWCVQTATAGWERMGCRCSWRSYGHFHCSPCSCHWQGGTGSCPIKHGGNKPDSTGDMWPVKPQQQYQQWESEEVTD